MKFLVPIDFSENALHAATYALTLAKEKPKSSIHLVHVITPIVNDPILIPDIEKAAIIALEKIVKELGAICSTCSFSCSVKIGETSTEINNAAKEVNTGVVVMGIRGIGEKSRFLFGSNTISLIDKSSRPVLVIPESASLNAPQKIVFATDYYDSDLEALQNLVPIAATFNSEIIITHIFEDAQDEPLEQGMMDFMSREMSAKFQYPRTRYNIYNGKNITTGIRDFCKTTKADLLVLSARKLNTFQRLFKKSVTEEISYNSDIPLLVFHVHQK